MDKYKELFKEGMTQDEFNAIVEKVSQASSDKIRTEYSAKIKELEAKIPQPKSEQETEIEKRLKELEAKESHYLLKDKLSELGLPSELSSYLKGADGLEQFQEVVNQMTLNGSYKPKEHKKTESTITKDQFSKMNYKQRADLYESQPDLYKQLSQDN